MRSPTPRSHSAARSRQSWPRPVRRRRPEKARRRPSRGSCAWRPAGQRLSRLTLPRVTASSSCSRSCRPNAYMHACTHHAHAHTSMHMHIMHTSMHMGGVCSPDRQVDLGGCPDSTAWPYSLLPRTSMADTQIRTSEQHVHVVAHPQLQPQLQRSALPMRTLLTRAPTWTFSACCCLLAPTANRTRTHQVHSK